MIRRVKLKSLISHLGFHGQNGVAYRKFPEPPIGIALALKRDRRAIKEHWAFEANRVPNIFTRGGLGAF
jgi:hypothetical protein